MARRSKPYSLYEEKERRRSRASAKYKREYGAFTDVFVKLVVYIFFGVFIALWYIAKELFSFLFCRNKSKNKTEKEDPVLRENAKPTALQWAGCLAIGLICLCPILRLRNPPADIADISFLFIVFFVLPFLVATLCVVDYNKTKYRSYQSKKSEIAPVSSKSYTGETTDKTAPEEAIAEIDQMNAKILMNEFQDTLKIMQKTSEPSTFFSRYDLLMERLDNMIELQQKGVKFTGNLSDLKKMSLDQENIADTVNVLIDNAYNKQIKKLSTLKTERGRENSNNRWYASFEPYFDKMPARSKTYLDLKLEALKEV